MNTAVTESDKMEEAVPELKKESDIKTPQPDKKQGKDEKSRKKDTKSVNKMLKNLGQYENSEDKLAAVCKKYTEILDENRKFQQTIKQLEKRITMIQRENEQINVEWHKALLTRSNLESLCRELQKQNKSIKEESLLKIREEEKKRKEVSLKFQNTLAEITALMNQNNEENERLHEDKMELTKKFNVMHEQMERFEKLHKEIKLEMAEEKEALLKEKQQLLFKLAEYHAQVQEHQATEAKLRSKISMYNDKYDEFQNALTKSNEVFGGFNEEMEKMSKKILKLEKETSVWKQRWENTHSSLLEVAADKQIRDAEIATLNRKCSLLQELCRGFQQERASLIAQLKEKNRTESETLEDKSNLVDKINCISIDNKELQESLKSLTLDDEYDIEDKPNSVQMLEKDNNQKEEDDDTVVNVVSDEIAQNKTEDNVPDSNEASNKSTDDSKVREQETCDSKAKETENESDTAALDNLEKNETIETTKPIEMND